MAWNAPLPNRHSLLSQAAPCRQKSCNSVMHCTKASRAVLALCSATMRAQPESAKVNAAANTTERAKSSDGMECPLAKPAFPFKSGCALSTEILQFGHALHKSFASGFGTLFRDNACTA